MRLVDLKERRGWSWEDVQRWLSREEYKVAIGVLFYKVGGGEALRYKKGDIG